MQHTTLAPGLDVNRTISGLWQVSGSHGPINPLKAVAQMHDYHDHGLKTWDVADIYGPAEDFVGTFLEELEARQGVEARNSVRVLTKWVPTTAGKREVPDVEYTLAYVEKNIDRSLKRLGVDRLDLLQFHWWNYEDKRLFEALDQLKKLQDKGKIQHIGVTNFDAPHLERLLKEGFPIVSNQVRFSLLDRRAERGLLSVCSKHNVKLLVFGTLCGGLLDEKYLGQQDPESNKAFEKRGLYHKLINNFGGWQLFQRLLKTLDEISQEHGVSLSAVASRYILDKPNVAAVIIGARLGESDHIQKTLEINKLELSADETKRITRLLDTGNHLTDLMGEVASEYRGRGFREQ